MSNEHVTLILDIDASQAVTALNRLATTTAQLGITLHCTSCPVCAYYYRRRGQVLLLAVCVEAGRRRLQPMQLLLRYLRSVHARHLAGESLSTRPFTPPRRKLYPAGTRITVQRVCNGCQKPLGDASRDELDAATTGPLPDVRLECGCWTEAA